MHERPPLAQPISVGPAVASTRVESIGHQRRADDCPASVRRRAAALCRPVSQGGATVLAAVTDRSSPRSDWRCRWTRKLNIGCRPRPGLNTVAVGPDGLRCGTGVAQGRVTTPRTDATLLRAVGRRRPAERLTADRGGRLCQPAIEIIQKRRNFDALGRRSQPQTGEPIWIETSNRAARSRDPPGTRRPAPTLVSARLGIDGREATTANLDETKPTQGFLATLPRI